MVLEKEVIYPNPKIATILNHEDIVSRIPMDYIQDNEDLFGTLSQQVLTVPTRNTKWKYLFFHDSSVFRPAAKAFEKSEKDNENTNLPAKYTEYLKGTTAYRDFWIEERRRCLEGYESSGVKITGDHYAYLNFCPILKSEDSGAKITKKVRGFPDFWDGDFEYFWSREIARLGVAKPLISDEEYQKFLKKSEEQQQKLNKKLFKGLMLESKIRDGALNGGYNLIVGKSRRKGYSYKNAAVGANNYFHSPERITLYTAYEKRFLYPSKTSTFLFSQKVKGMTNQ